MTYTSIIKTLSIILCFLPAIFGCDNLPQGEPIKRTEKETLNYLVANSDLIASVDILGGTDKPRVSFSDIPKKVNATIISIIKGIENRDKSGIVSTPKNISSGALMSAVVLRNGKHLAFLSMKGEVYQPTTGFSLFEIFNNKVHPIWRPDQYKETGPNGMKVSSGIDLKEVLQEIRDEMAKI